MLTLLEVFNGYTKCGILLRCKGLNLLKRFNLNIDVKNLNKIKICILIAIAACNTIIFWHCSKKAC